MREVVIAPDFEGWRTAARRLIQERAAPSGLAWREGAAAERRGPGTAAGGPAAPPERGGAEFRVPRAFIEVARAAARHPDPSRWALLYSVLWRVLHDDRNLLARTADPEVARLLTLRDAAPSRSPAVPAAGGLFPSLEIPVSSPAPAAAPGTEVPTARPFLPETSDLSALRAAAAGCRGCDLYREATQTVFGEGPASARLVLVGEQPGDQEDRRGAPFVGPAGEVLDRALGEAGLVRSEIYVTNAVKHFKFVIQRGGRRIHQTPQRIEIGACRPWLEAELAAIRPELLVCLGATASKALLGPDFRLMKERGRFLTGTPWAPRVIATLHPSAVLRGDSPRAQEALYGLLLEDLRAVAREVTPPPAS